MSKDNDEKLAVLWDRSEDSKDFQTETREFQTRLLAEIHNIHYDIKSLPEQIKGNLDKDYVTRREFKAVKAVFTSIATFVSLLIGTFTYFNRH
jgi:hypothetical protein